MVQTKRPQISFGFKEHEEDLVETNTMRCPACEHVSVTKIIDDSPHLGIMFQPDGDYFVCLNPKCGVERIYGENAILMRSGNEEGKKKV
jgi:hypothetical protein